MAKRSNQPRPIPLRNLGSGMDNSIHRHSHDHQQGDPRIVDFVRKQDILCCNPRQSRESTPLSPPDLSVSACKRNFFDNLDGSLARNIHRIQQRTFTRPTNAFGDIDFVGYGEEFKKYIKVATVTSMETIEKLFTDAWQLPKPSLLISITGGAGNLNLSARTKEKLQKGIIKAATNSGAWIMTCGTNNGVMKLVGEAIRDYGYTASSKLVALGVAPWGCVRNKSQLLSGGDGPCPGSWPAHYVMRGGCDDNSAPLDPNHTHFVLVDNGSQGKWEAEIPFRANIERYFSAIKKVPVCLLMVGGGKGTLNTVHSAVSRDIPTIIIQGSGRMADVLATAFLMAQKDQTVSKDKEGHDCVQTTATLDDVQLLEIRDLLKSRNFPFDSRQLAKIRDIVCRADLITIYEMSERDTTLDYVILKSLLHVNQDNDIRLALQWNRADVAHDILTLDRTWQTENMHDLLFVAMTKNQVQFVDMFLNIGVNLNDFLTLDRLGQLYQSIPKKFVFNQILCYMNPDSSREFRLEDLGLVIYQLLGHFYQDYHSSTRQILLGVNAHAREVFIWAVLNNYRDMARLFWQEGKHNTVAALFAQKVARSMRRWTLDIEFKEELDTTANEFQTLAVSVLNKCYNKSIKLTYQLLKRNNPHWGNTSCLMFASHTKCRAFIRQAACQSLLTRIWRNPVKYTTSIITILLAIPFPFVLYWVDYSHSKKETRITRTQTGAEARTQRTEDAEVLLSQNNNTDDGGEAPTTGNPPTVQTVQTECTNSESVCSKLCQLPKKCFKFYSSPMVTFTFDMLFYVLFILLFSYILIVQLTDDFHWLEGVLIVWAITYFIEEFRTFAYLYQQSITATLALYFHDRTNIVDCILMVTFSVGFVLRFVEANNNLIWTRVVLSLTCAMFCVRILHFFSFNKRLGPIVIMVSKMMKDLIAFVVILLVFFIAFAIMSEAILYPNTPFTPSFIFHFPRKAYWQIYGELFLDVFEESSTCTNDPAIWKNHTELRCPTKEGRYLVPILLACYILISNVLLLNLLIALFNYSVQAVKDDADAYWSMVRFKLIYEYVKRPGLPPPFIMFCHLWQLACFICSHVCCEDGPDQGDEFCNNVTNGKEDRKLLAWENMIADSFQCDIWDTEYTGKEEESTEDIKEEIEKTERLKSMEKELQETRKTLEIIQSAVQDLVENIPPAKRRPPSLSSIHEEETKKQKLNDFLEELAKSNFRSRISPYHGTTVERCHVDDSHVSWEEELPDYMPDHFTKQKILNQPHFADVDLSPMTPSEREAAITFNKGDRASYQGLYRVVDGLPQNPVGRTGLMGRGCLARWGPNKSYDPIVTRWKRDSSDSIMRRGDKPVLEFLAVLRKDSSLWSLPGGYQTPGVSPLDTMKVNVHARDDSWKKRLEEKKHELYRGYADDPVNTDNAWRETLVINYHDEEGIILRDVTFLVGKDVSLVAWRTVISSLPLWGAHPYFLQKAADHLKAAF